MEHMAEKSSHDTPASPSIPSYNSNIISIIIFLISFVAALLPKEFSRFRAFISCIPIITEFSTGIQLSSVIDVMMHMNMPEGEHSHDMLPSFASGLCFLVLLGIDVIFLHGPAGETGNKTEKKADSTLGLSSNVIVENGIPAFENSSSLHGSHEGCGNHDHHHKEDSHHSHDCCESIGTCNTSKIGKSKTKMQAMAAILAISIHSFLEGLEVEGNLKKQFAFIAGLTFHKFVESFSIGNSLNNSIFSNSTKLILILYYSLLTPVAIIIRNHGNLKSFFDGYAIKWIHALCLGSLFFVVFFESIGHIFHGGVHMKRKVAAIITGYLIGCLAIFLAHSGHHNHSHHHH